MASAERAELVYVNDGEVGIKRRRAGKGFSYVRYGGEKVYNKEDLARIRALAIPPAWTDVWICADASGHIQATGRDQRGRKQYRYHAAWTACRDEAKFSSLAAFAHALPSLRDRVEADLSLRGLPREKVIASVIWLLDKTMIRIGNDAYRRENKSFGLTTLHDRHVQVEGSNLRFSFRGKSGQEWKLKLQDRRIARIVRAVQDVPGQHLFQYLDEDGARREIRSQNVNAYIREAIGDEFTAKHFRTWGASVMAGGEFAEVPLPDTKRAQAVELNALIDKVAARIRNTRAVCRRCYIHPLIIDGWLEGRLQQEIGDIRRRARKPLKGLDDEESLFLRWLDRQMVQTPRELVDA
nr:DNA topoisomerase IB [Aquamicrobium zhengzhouense]